MPTQHFVQMRMPKPSPARSRDPGLAGPQRHRSYLGKVSYARWDASEDMHNPILRPTPRFSLDALVRSCTRTFSCPLMPVFEAASQETCPFSLAVWLQMSTPPFTVPSSHVADAQVPVFPGITWTRGRSSQQSRVWLARDIYSAPYKVPPVHYSRSSGQAMRNLLRGEQSRREDRETGGPRYSLVFPGAKLTKQPRSDREPIRWFPSPNRGGFQPNGPHTDASCQSWAIRRGPRWDETQPNAAFSPPDENWTLTA